VVLKWQEIREIQEKYQGKPTFHFDELFDAHIFACYRVDVILLDVFLDQPPLEYRTGARRKDWNVRNFIGNWGKVKTPISFQLLKVKISTVGKSLKFDRKTIATMLTGRSTYSHRLVTYFLFSYSTANVYFLIFFQSFLDQSKFVFVLWRSAGIGQPTNGDANRKFEFETVTRRRH
jgi:hypothetical protein